MPSERTNRRLAGDSEAAPINSAPAADDEVARRHPGQERDAFDTDRPTPQRDSVTAHQPDPGNRYAAGRCLIAAFGRHGKSAQHRDNAETDQANGEKALRHLLPHPPHRARGKARRGRRGHVCLDWYHLGLWASAPPDIPNFPQPNSPYPRPLQRRAGSVAEMMVARCGPAVVRNKLPIIGSTSVQKRKYDVNQS